MSYIRIISGSLRGKRIKGPDLEWVKPTKDFVKESLFNILSNQFDLSNCFVLDLFSGSGNISYEFASRGAKHITIVEKDTKCSRFIVNQMKTIGIEHFTLVTNNAFLFLRKKPPFPYHIIFADPPYNLPLEDYGNLVEYCLSNYLEKEGLLCLEHQKRVLLDHLEGCYMTRIYGNTRLSFFKKL